MCIQCTRQFRKCYSEQEDKKRTTTAKAKEKKSINGRSDDLFGGTMIFLLFARLHQSEFGAATAGQNSPITQNAIYKIAQFWDWLVPTVEEPMAKTGNLGRNRSIIGGEFRYSTAQE